MVDPANLPLPSALQANANSTAQNKEGPPVEFLSVIFNQREQRDVLRISKMAITPMWLKKNMYEKLDTDVHFELPSIDRNALQARYSTFERNLNSRTGPTHQINELKAKAQAMYTSAFQEGCEPKVLLTHQHKLSQFIDSNS